MGKHRHKKSFYDVDEDELQSSDKHRHRHRRRHLCDKQDETKRRVPSMSSFNNSKIDDDDVALQSPPMKRQRSSSNGSQSPSKVLSQLIEDPEFLASAGPKAKEFAETARQLLAKPDLDSTTQQIICAMAQAAVNVGKRLHSSLSSTPTDQCVDDITVTNSTTYSSSALLSPTLSNASSSSASNTPHQQCQSIITSYEESKSGTEIESNEGILIKQMIERAMKLTQQGDTRHAQHLLGIIHEKLSNKRKRIADTPITISNRNDNEKLRNSSSSDVYSWTPLSSDDLQYNNNTKVSPTESEQSNDYSNASFSSYPPPPPLPPPPPPPPLPDTNTIEAPPPPPVPIPPIEQVQELLSNPTEVQDILKKMFGTNDNLKVSSPDEYQLQSHVTPSLSYHSQPALPYNNVPIYAAAPRLNNPTNPSSRFVTSLPSTIPSDPQPYNSSLAYMQGNRRNLPPSQTNDRCFSSSNNKPKQTTIPLHNRSFSFSSPSPSINNVALPLVGDSLMQSTVASPLMKANLKFPLPSSVTTPLESIPTRWSNNNEQQQRGLHPFWCATCALGFPHQIAYQDHLRSHIPCNVPGCSYAASEHLVRIHHQNIHDNNLRSRTGHTFLHQTRPTFHQQQTFEPPWPLMRM